MVLGLTVFPTRIGCSEDVDMVQKKEKINSFLKIYDKLNQNQYQKNKRNVKLYFSLIVEIIICKYTLLGGFFVRSTI